MPSLGLTLTQSQNDEELETNAWTLCTLNHRQQGNLEKVSDVGGGRAIERSASLVL